MKLLDSHAHLMDSAFDADRNAVLERAANAEVQALLLVGYDLASSRAAIDLASQLPNAYASVGIHPNSASEASEHDWSELALLARDPSVVAIGETGLDYYRQFTPRARQREALQWHLDLATELGKPVVIHNRDADADVAEALEGHAGAGVLHCFSSTDPRYLARMLEVGYMVSFAGTLTYKSAADLRAMAARVPLDRLLVETDCPYLAPVPHRGKRNEPAFVHATAACLADIVGQSLDDLADRVWSNMLKTFPAFAALAHA